MSFNRVHFIISLLATICPMPMLV